MNDISKNKWENNYCCPVNFTYNLSFRSEQGICSKLTGQ
jgi:hypothetical protein